MIKLSNNPKGFQKMIQTFTINEQEIAFNDVSYDGYTFREFYPLKDPQTGPGWYIFGRNREKYSLEGYIMLCARPNLKPRKHPHYNLKIRRGFKTLKEAKEVCKTLNEMFK